MNGMQTYIKFVVHSDLNDELVYAEFDSKKEAIRYARDYSNEFTYVDKVECFLDPETGRIDEIVSSTTVWTYLDESLEDPQPSTEEEDYWDMMVDQSEPNENDRYDIGDTTWFESLDNLVEDMEENEDMVECKECFDLFPKADCVKLAFGYICPTCNHGSEVADSDIFKIEFPEYEKFSGTEEEYPTVEVENEPETVELEMENENDPISTPEEAVPFLVNDEVEAVAGYEKAAEVVADSDLENKEEILDTIDHIKEEEEEHIEELQDLMPSEEDKIVEVENDPISDETETTESQPINEDISVTLTPDQLTEFSEHLKSVDADGFTETIEVSEVIEPASNGLGEDEISASLYWSIDENAFKFDLSVYHTSEDNNGEVGPDGYLTDDYYETYATIEELYNDYPTYVEYLYNEYKSTLTEHVNDRAEPIESDQELEGTDNAVVDCKVADVVTHSEDEKPVDCEGKKKPLEKPLTEGFTFSLNNEKDLAEFTKLCQEVGIKTIGDLDLFTKESANEPGNILDKLRAYRAELGDDFKIKEKLDVTNGYPHIKSVATLVHKAVDNYTKDNRVATRPDGTSFYVLGDKTNSDPEKMKKTILDALASEGYDPEVVQYVEKGSLYGYVVDKIRMTSRMTMSYKKESLTESLYNFTEEEMTEYNMDEDGISLDSYDEYVRCNWCGEVFAVDQCIFEANMGWLCDRCEAAIRSRGEKLTILTNPTDDEIVATLTEAKKMTRDEMIAKEGTDDVDLINAGRPEEDRVELVEEAEDVELDESAILAAAASGVIVDVVKRIFDKVGDHKKKSKWIDFRKYIIEKAPDGKINIWNLDGEQVASDMKTVKAAKEKIKTLPKPKKVKATEEPKKEEEKSEETSVDTNKEE